MSFDALASCINITDVKPISKLVLLVLGNYANEEWQSYPSKTKLAELCNCDEQTIKRALDELIEKKIIKSQARYSNGKQLSNLYTILIRGVKIRGAKIDKLGGSNLYPNTIKDTINIKNEYTEDFEIFWKRYPPCENGKKVGKHETSLEFKKCKDKNILMTCLKNYIDFKKGRFIHSPLKWIKKKIYLDFKTKEKEVVYQSKNNLAG
jgi:hypothetical protein